MDPIPYSCMHPHLFACLLCCVVKHHQVACLWCMVAPTHTSHQANNAPTTLCCFRCCTTTQQSAALWCGHHQQQQHKATQQHKVCNTRWRLSMAGFDCGFIKHIGGIVNNQLANHVHKVWPQQQHPVFHHLNTTTTTTQSMLQLPHNKWLFEVHTHTWTQASWQ